MNLPPVECAETAPSSQFPIDAHTQYAPNAAPRASPPSDSPSIRPAWPGSSPSHLAPCFETLHFPKYTLLLHETDSSRRLSRPAVTVSHPVTPRSPGSPNFQD